MCYIEDMSPNQQKENRVLSVMKSGDPLELGRFFEDQDPVTAALLIAFLPVSRASQILASFSLITQKNIVIKLFQLRNLDGLQLHSLIAKMSERWGEVPSSPPPELLGGPSYTGNVLKQIPTHQLSYLLRALREEEPDIAKTLESDIFDSTKP